MAVEINGMTPLIQVFDMPRSLAFYRDVLGFTVVSDSGNGDATRTAEFLLDKGVDPYAGMKTWLAGPHYAVSSGHLDTVKMLIEQKVSFEIKNNYGGTRARTGSLVGCKRA